MNARPARRWTIVAAWFEGPDPAGPASRWLDDFIDDPALVFRKQGPVRRARSWHERRGQVTPAGEWSGHLRQARAALADRPDGVVACFPPLAMCVALLKRLGRHKPRIIAYNYNLGGFPSGAKRRLARLVAAEIDVYVVHAPSEVEPYAAYLDVPRDRVRFIPLQRGRIDVPRAEDTEAPFLLAMGSAHRDYATLIEAVDALAIPTVIVTRAADIEALPRSPHVEFRSGLAPEACMDLLARARLSVTPISNLTTASGQVTLLDAMQLGVPLIVTDCPGAEGYVEDGRTGLLVPPFDVAAMGTAIASLWDDSARRAALAKAAQAESLSRFSDEAAAAASSRCLTSYRSRGPNEGARIIQADFS